jgi:hypothetical protein
MRNNMDLDYRFESHGRILSGQLKSSLELKYAISRLNTHSLGAILSLSRGLGIQKVIEGVYGDKLSLHLALLGFDNR